MKILIARTGRQISLHDSVAHVQKRTKGYHFYSLKLVYGSKGVWLVPADYSPEENGNSFEHFLSDMRNHFSGVSFQLIYQLWDGQDQHLGVV